MKARRGSHRATLALAVLMQATLPSCAGSQPAEAPDALLVARLPANRSEAAEPARLVIRDEAAWQRYWSASRSAGAVPQVDFARNVVVVAALGQRPSGGYRVTMNIASASDAEIILDVVEEVPGPTCIATMAVTYPRDIIVVAAQNRTIQFRETTRTRSCN
jgi:protease stability complex PrcB-like protein